MSVKTNFVPTGILLIVAFLNGGLIMIIEITGARAMAPFYGNSIAVWSSIIGITLGALALGYALGGFLIDRFTTSAWISLALAIAGVSIFGIPLWGHILMAWMYPLGLHLGSLLSSALILLPPLLAMGSVSPICIRLATRQVSEVGSIAGLFYAISTIGGVIATLVTGFWMAPLLGIRITCFIAGTIAGVLAIIILLLKRSLASMGVMVVFAIPSILLLSEMPADPVKGTKIIYQVDTITGKIKVVDIIRERDQDRKRFLIVDGITQTCFDVDSGEPSPKSYVHLISAYATALAKNSSIFLLGLGGGIVAKQIKKYRPDARILASEIEPYIVYIAKNFFDLPEDCQVIVGDARCHIRQMKQKQRLFDCVIMDLYTAETEPWYMYTRETLADIKQILSTNGIFIINFIGFWSGDTRAIQAILGTLSFCGFHYKAYLTDKSNPVTNIVIFASPSQVPAVEEIISFDKLPRFKQKVVREMLENKLLLPPGDVLSDDRNPIDILSRDSQEWNRNHVLRTIVSWEILFR